MSKYIDADKLKAKVKELNLATKTYEEQVAFNNALEMVVEIIDSLQQEQPEVDYNKFEKLFDDFCERNKGHHITSHDACMWFWELGLNARKEK